jgi:hypothetical protein
MDRTVCPASNGECAKNVGVRHPVLGLVAATLTACGLDITGTASGDAADGGDAGGGAVDGSGGDGRGGSGGDGGSGGSGGDGSVDAGGDASQRADAEVCPPARCALAPPPGWSLVAYAPNRFASCPAGFVTEDTLEEPRAALGACTCGECVTQTAPSCSDGWLGVTYDEETAPTCGLTGVPLSAARGACTPFDGHTGTHTFVTPPPPSGGACFTPSVAHDAVTTQSVRACVPAKCASPCDPSLGPGFTTCLRAPGDVACPASAPRKHTVGKHAAMTCPPCPCSLLASCSGALALYADDHCADELVRIPAGLCYTTGYQRLHSYKWNGAKTSICIVGLPPAGTAALDDPATICCP